MKVFKAKLFLAWYLVLHVFRSLHRLFATKEPQVKKFQEAYWKEAPSWFLTPSERQQFSTFSGCINCGLCELDCDVIAQGETTTFKPSWVALACSRYTPDYELFTEVAEVCGKCVSCTVLCPTQVPIRKMARFVLEKVRIWKASV